MAQKKIFYFLPLLLFILLVTSFASLLLYPEKAEIILKPMPPLALEDLKTADIKGPALINFFASWCAPCRAEHDTLMELAKIHKLPIYGIAYKDKPQDTDRYLKNLGDPYTKIGFDKKGRAFIEWGLSGVPESFLIDGNNMIRTHHAGVLLAEDMKTTILPLMERIGKE